MAVFIQIKNENIVQIDDKTRIDVEGTFISPDESAITLIEIQPEAASGYVDVTSTKYLDWAYDSAGTKAVSVRVTTDGSPIVKTSEILVLSVADDKLFSTDKDIVSHEVDIYRFLRPGRSTFLDFHRIAQRMILDDLDQRGITDNQGNKLTKADIFDVQEVAEWSRYLTLYLIFVSVQSEVDDVYATKAQGYKEMAVRNASRAFLRLDLDGDGVEDRRQDLITTMRMRR